MDYSSFVLLKHMLEQKLDTSQYNVSNYYYNEYLECILEVAKIFLNILLNEPQSVANGYRIYIQKVKVDSYYISG